jgi:hypothetical protein
MSDGSRDSIVNDQEAILLKYIHPDTHGPLMQCSSTWAIKNICYFISKRDVTGAEIPKFCIFIRYSGTNLNRNPIQGCGNTEMFG